MEQLCSCLRVILGQAKAISEGRKTLIYTVQETNSTTPNPSAVHTVRLAEITDINPITRLIALAETEVVSSNVKAFYMCDLCMFTIDLTSILVTPGSTVKNELLIAVVLEHLVPHTESLLSVIANTAGSKTFNFKMEVKAKVTTERNGQRKIVLSLQKKFVSSQSGLEIVLEKDEERTLNQLRASVRADRQKNFVNIRTKSDGGTYKKFIFSIQSVFQFCLIFHFYPIFIFQFMSNLQFLSNFQFVPFFSNILIFFFFQFSIQFFLQFCPSFSSC